MPTYSEDGKWLWDGKEWIPSPPNQNPVVGNNPPQQQLPQQAAPNVPMSVSDSVVQGAVSQKTQHIENFGPQSMQIKDSVVMGGVVQNTFVTQTVDQEMISHVMVELQNLRLDVDSLRLGLDSGKKVQIKDKDTVNRIAKLNETVMNAELAGGTSLLDKETYEALSTVALSANARGSGYMTNAYGSRIENLEEKVQLAKRKGIIAWWCLAMSSWRTPEGFKNYIEAAEIYLETRDNRILTFRFNHCEKQLESSRFYLSRFNVWMTRVFFGGRIRKYELEAAKDPTIPSWSELDSLRAKARDMYLLVKSARIQTLLLA